MIDSSTETLKQQLPIGHQTNTTGLAVDDARRLLLANRDLVKWLDNKLGSSDELWSGQTAAGLLTHEILAELDSCFQEMQPHIKLRLLLAIPHLSNRNLEAWREPLGNLLSLALQDADDWVQAVADLLRNFPHEGSISFCPADDSSHFSRTLIELRKILRSREGELRLLPPDASFCTKSAIGARFVGANQQTALRHFALRRRPKSATLKADLVKKAADLASQPKNKAANASLSSVVPIRSRNMAKKMDNSPMRGIPSQNVTKLSGGFTNEPKKFNVRPALKRDGGAKLIDIAETPQALKLRRKEWESEQKVQRQVEKDDAKKRLVEEKEAKKQAIIAQRAQLVANKEAKKAGGKIDEVTPAAVEPDTTPAISTNATPDYAAALLRTSSMPSHNNMMSNVPVASTSSYTLPSYAAVQQHPTMSQQSSVDGHHSSSIVQKRVLTVSSEIMAQAQEMFRDANKLSRPEKALILGFMAGSRDNPCPQMGPVLTVRLSETRENATTADGNRHLVMVETFFQMNYTNGDWKRLKKVRPLRPEELVDTL